VWLKICALVDHQNKVPTPSGKSWIFCKISSPWKVLENGFGPVKSCKFQCKVLESPGIFKAMMCEVDTDAGADAKICKKIAQIYLYIRKKLPAAGAPPLTP